MIVSGTWKTRVVVWALPIAFVVGFGAGSYAARVAMVPDSPLALAHLPEIKDGAPLMVPAAQAAWQLDGRVEALPEAVPQAAPEAVDLSATEGLQAPPKRALLLAASSTRRLQFDGLSRHAEQSSEARLEKAVLRVADRRQAEQITVQAGDTLSNILDRAEIDSAQAHAIVKALRGVYDPRKLKVGQEMLITAANRDAVLGRQLMRLALDLDFDHRIEVTRGPDGAYSAHKIERPKRSEMVRRTGRIDDSLFLSADRAGVPRSVTVELMRLLSWDVDFQRDIRVGDAFETLFEEVSLEDQSGPVRGGDVLYASLSLSGEVLDAFRFEQEPGEIEYFDRTGRSLRKFLLRTPVDGARLSSRFGMRKHPILGYSRMHKGVDFAAPRGTPIYAAGSGRIAAAGRKGSYGKYIKIRHSGEYSTAYAHLSRIAKGIRPGKRVRQGQVIGYVGSTGRSTGPHLHYEVLRNDAQINPLKVKQPPTTQLAGADLERFRKEVARIDRLRGELSDGATLVAGNAGVEPIAIPVAAIR
ncbi:MAG: peptidoglycan DD-metalloendopeptidase family protein [Pseudomonadota bacterium]